MKKIIVLISTVLVVLTSFSIIHLKKIPEEEKIDNISTEKVEKEKISTVEEENTIVSEEVINEVEKPKDKIIQDSSDNITSKSTDTSTKKEEPIKENNVTNSESKETSSKANINNIVEEPKVDKKSYVGIPDPNNFNYSMHNGVIEYNSEQRDKCIEDSIEFSFKDTVDITNAFCLDVYDSDNNILGYYLYIKCTSGNCNKYKN